MRVSPYRLEHVLILNTDVWTGCTEWRDSRMWTPVVLLWKHAPVVNRDVLGWFSWGVNIIVSAYGDGAIRAGAGAIHPCRDHHSKTSDPRPITTTRLIGWQTILVPPTSRRVRRHPGRVMARWQQSDVVLNESAWQRWGWDQQRGLLSKRECLTKTEAPLLSPPLVAHANATAACFPGVVSLRNIRWWDKAAICYTHTQDPIWLRLVWLCLNANLTLNVSTQLALISKCLCI